MKSEDYLHSIIYCIVRIALDHEKFGDNELYGLDYKQAFNIINPFYYNPDDFYDLTYEQQGEHVKYDKYILSWGLGFHCANPKVVINDVIAHFFVRSQNWLS